MKTVIALALSSTVLVACGTQQEQESHSRQTSQADSEQTSKVPNSQDSNAEGLSLSSELEGLGIL